MIGESAVREAEGRLRPAPGPYPFDVEAGDRFVRKPSVLAAGTGYVRPGSRGLADALAGARARAGARGSRQRLTIKRDGAGAGRWVVQDVRK